MALTFESAVDSLSAMFPEWDKETLGSVLISNGGRVEATIEMILSMEGGGGNGGQSNDNLSSEGANASDSERLSNLPVTNTVQSRGGNYRGTKCDLPNDFLRLPNSSKPTTTPRVLADEELALILQNELFQRELLNQGYAREGDGGNSRFWPDFGIRTTNQSNNAAANAQAMPDLGIMKSLSSMSETAKRNLSSLALRFSSNNDTAQSGTRQENKPLVGENNDDDEDEVISFEDTSSGGQHFLNGYENRDNYWTNNPVLESSAKK